MQEFTIRYEAFHTGLRPARRSRRERAFLMECFNLRPFQGHTVGVQPIINPRPSVDVTFPFPQLMVGSRLVQLNNNSIQLLGTDFMPTSTFSTMVGDSWHWADFGDYLVFTNGTAAYEYVPGDGFAAIADVQFSTCCNYNGQLFVGGFITPWHDADLAYVGWSKIGSSKFMLDRMNTSGYARMSKGGECLRVMKLGKDIIAYGSNNLDVFTPVSEPVVTFGKQLLDIIPGLASRSAVGGTDLMHVLVDGVGQLWRLTAGPKPELLGYQEFFEQMLGTDIVVTYNASDASFTIANDQVSYLLSDGGLSRQFQAITSQSAYQGGVIGFYESVDDQGFELKTDTVDFGYRGLKTLSSIELAFSSDVPVYAAVDWRSNTNQPFRPSKWVPLNARGQATLMVTANEFRLKLQSASFENVEIDYMLIKYKPSDRRNLRGPTHADKINSGTDS